MNTQNYFASPTGRTIIGLLFLLLPYQTNATLLSLQTEQTSIQLGQVFKLDLVASQPSDIVSAFSTDIHYSDNIAFESVVFSGLLGDGLSTSLQSVSSLNNLLSFSELSLLFDNELDALQSGGPITLASVFVRATDIGNASFSIGDNELIGSLFTPHTTQVNSPLNIDIIAASVPEPSGILILLFGLIALIKQSRCSH